MKKLIKDRKGAATITIILVAALVVILFVIGLYIKLNWRTFKAEASFGFAIAMLIVFIIAAIYILIRLSLRRSRKEKEKARLEKERLEQERIAAGGKPSTLGNGKLEASDVSEVAGKALDKIDKFVQGGE
jgi:uncharacterized membrane protein